MQRKLVLLVFIIVLYCSMFPRWDASGDTVLASQSRITFQRNQIPDLDVYYDDYSFVFELKDYFIRVRPFVIFNETYYGLRQIVTWLKNNFPNINYSWLADKSPNLIHYGYNLTKLPQKIADRIDYLGFRLVDYNFPLSWFKLETMYDVENDCNMSRISIPKANLVFGFEDLYPYGYSIEHVNATYVLVGNVRGKTSLYADPITYSSPTITVIGGTVGVPLTFMDVWNSDQAGGWDVVSNNNNTDTQFEFNCKLYFGNGTSQGTTYFNDTNKQITFTDNIVSAHYEAWMYVSRFAFLEFGELTNATEKSTSEGCGFFSLETGKVTYICYVGHSSNTGVNFYSCHFYSPRGSWISGTNARIYNGIGTNLISILDHASSDVFSIILEEGSSALYYPRGSWDRISVTEFTYIIYTFYAGGISNLYGRGNTFVGYMHGGFDEPETLNLTNPDVDSWSFVWVAGSTGEVFRLYTFDATFTFDNGSYAEGANITISNDYLGTSDSWILTDNGSIPQQTYIHGHYNLTGGDTIYDYNPYRITATLDGHESYTQLINITGRESLTVALTSSPFDWFMYMLIIGVICVILFVYALAKD